MNEDAKIEALEGEGAAPAEATPAAPAEAVPVPAAPVDELAGDDRWARVGGALMSAGLAAGRFTAKAGTRVGSAVAGAYHAMDPDLRRHIGELPLLGLTMLAPGRTTDVLALPDDGANIVVFVHGLGGSPGNFWPMRSWFRLRGRTRSYAVTFPDGRSIAELAGLLATFLEEVARVNEGSGAGRIDLVAHSMGGLVCRAALLDPAVRARVATLVTLGTPHEGTYLARFGASTSVLDLRPTSDIVERLRGQLPWRGPPEMPRLVAFWSGADLLLLPHQSGRVDGAENVEIAGSTHYGYLLRLDAWDAVLGVL